jgi:hypothetical protein
MNALCCSIYYLVVCLPTNELLLRKSIIIGFGVKLNFIGLRFVGFWEFSMNSMSNSHAFDPSFGSACDWYWLWRSRIDSACKIISSSVLLSSSSLLHFSGKLATCWRMKKQKRRILKVDVSKYRSIPSPAPASSERLSPLSDTSSFVFYMAVPV